MPYGIAKSKGGDSPKNDAAMEKKVNAMQGKGIGKVSAIKIAKSQMGKKKSFDDHFSKLKRGQK